MKKFILLGLALPLLSFANPEVLDSRIKGYQIGACDWWTSVQGNTGFAYGCATYPQRIVIPDGYDVSNALKAADAKIADLERRVAELEKKIPQ